MMKHLKKICVMLTLLLSLAAAPAFSQNNSFYLQQINFEQNDKGTLEFMLDNTDKFYGFQADITFPSGLNYNIDDLTLSYRFDEDSAYGLTTNLSGGVLHIAVYSSVSDREPIQENNGPLMTLPVTTASDFIGGDVIIKNITFVDSNDGDVNFEDTTTTIGVLSTSISLSPDKITLIKGFDDYNNKIIDVIYDPLSDFTVKDVMWESSNENNVSVDQNGKVTGINEGTATIKATTFDPLNDAYKGKSAQCEVTVEDPKTGLYLNVDELLIEKGSTESIEALLILDGVPFSDVENKEIEWVSSDENVITILPQNRDVFYVNDDDSSNDDDPSKKKVKNITQKGTITAIGDGTATLTLSYVDREKTLTAQCTVEVKTSIEKIEIEPYPVPTLYKGNTLQLEATVFPTNATDKTLTWTSSDPSVIEITEVDASTHIVTIKAISLSEDEWVVITATGKTLTGEISETYKVKVVPTPAESLTIKYNDEKVESLDVMMEFPSLLTAEVLPEDTTYPTVTWDSSNPLIASVDDDGLITPIRLGETIITATCQGLSAICHVTVIPYQVREIILTPDTTQLMVGQTVTIQTELIPENATDKTVKWSSSDEAIATVDADGKVTAKAPGEAHIKASCGIAEAICYVTVIPTLVTSITLNTESESLKVGETVQLVETVLPEDATNKTVTWSSSNVEIATVDEKGLVTAHALGDATITATANDGSEVKATCKISVIPTPADSIILLPDKAILKAGETIKVVATVLPETTTDKTIIWKSNNEDVATVDENGTVTAISVGETTITASCGTATATCTVTVDPIPVESIFLNKQSLNLIMGSSEQLIASVLPEYATDKTVTWTSSDETVATVSEAGEVTAIYKGSATITASTTNGKSANCLVTVSIPATGISLDKTVLTLEKGSNETLNATLTPEDTDDEIIWSSSDQNIATVSNGVVTAIEVGNTLITAKCGSVEATCSVEVIISPIGITLDKEFASLYVGENTTLTATVMPEDATDKTYTWSSSNDAIATVDANGNVTAIALGDVTITATTANGKTASCAVSVIPTPASSISIDKEKASLMVGEYILLLANVLPEDATDKSVTWTSSNESVASADDNGTVTAISLGEAIITASCGCVSATCLITVVPTPVTSIELSNQELLMRVNKTAELIPIILPDNATDKSVIWTSDNEEVATVTDNGIVTSKNPGTAIITVYSVSNPSVYDECKVTVEIEDNIIAVTGLTINKTKLDLIEGDSFSLIASVLPENATDKTVTWRSSDANIASVSADGLVNAIGVGSATIYASSSNGITVECVVNVTARTIAVTGLSLSNTQLLLTEGDTSELLAILRPENATDKTVFWTSNDSSIATVDSKGIVTAIKQGIATITATTANGLSADCSVTVIPAVIAVTDITLNDYILDLSIGDTHTLIATITPENATDKTVTWKSLDKTIAIVSENGVVTAVSPGSTVIYASSSNGLTAECKVNVGEPPVISVESISLSQSELTLREGYSADLIAIVRPDNATDKTLTWSSSDNSIATVDDKGIVTAIKQGLTTITATAVNGVKAECAVTVIPVIIAVNQIMISETSLTLTEGDFHTLTASIMPDNATDKTITWRSSDRAIATVSDSGVVNALSAGSTTILASSSNGLTAICNLTVLPAVIPVESISLSNTELLMREGYSTDLIAIVRPDNASDKNVRWSSSDEAILTFDVDDSDKDINRIILTALGQGSATITATSVFDPSIKAECQVTIEHENVITAVSGLTLNETEITLTEGDSFTLVATVTPEDATDKSVTWKSSDKTIATVSDNGLVYAIAPGTATIYASSSNGITVECKVTVNARVIDPDGLSLSNTELLMREGYSAELIAIVHPDNATDKTVVWASSDESIATVDARGIVTAIKQGNTVVTATTCNGITATCSVTVVPVVVSVTQILLSDKTLELTEGDTHTLTATILPDNATDKTVTWRSSDRAIATVSPDGVVTAVKAGIATIYASSSNGLTAECLVTVNPGIVPVESISLSNTELLMREGHTAELIAIVRPDNATDKSVTWSSSDDNIATVDQNGNVYAVKQGIAIITAASNNGIKAQCVVTVVPVIIPVTEIILSDYKLNLIEGDSYTLTAYILPEDATDKSVTWRSSDITVAVVAENGEVTAIRKGTAIIYASSSNGLTAVCEVTVDPRIIDVTSISLDPYSLMLAEGEITTLTATIAPVDATDKTVTWTSSDPNVAKVENGVVTPLKVGYTTITATSSNGLTAICYVTVYSRPLTPKQLLRKGDGTTCTFVTMMQISDAELSELGYRFVYGYTDAHGESMIIEETPLRYTHTTSEIYNDPTNDFWVFAVVENEEGKKINSNLRHLDGREEICFDTSIYGYPTNRGEISQIISMTSEEVKISVFTMDGVLIFSKNNIGESSVSEEIENLHLTKGIYILYINRGGTVESKKIVVR